MEGKPLIDFDWIYRHLDDVGTRTLQHLQLTLIPVFLGFIIALFLAIWVVRKPRVYGPLLAVSGLLYTIPSLAAFAFLRPIFGLSLITAVIPLTTYTLLILLRNNTEGFRAVPPRCARGGRGHGLLALGATAPDRAAARDPVDGRRRPARGRHRHRPRDGRVRPR